MTTLGICWSLLAASLKGQMQYRVNFLVMLLWGLVYQGTGFVFIWVVLTRFQALAGWTLGEIAFLYGLRLTAHGLQGLLFSNVGYVDLKVRQGEFDRYLVRPLAPLLQIMTETFRVNLLGDFLGGVALFLAANTLVEVGWSPAALAYLVLALLGGALAEAGVTLLVVSLSFRLLNVGNLLYLFDGILFSQFGNYPLKIFGGTLQFLLTFGLPLAFVAYFPATVLLARTDELLVHPLFAYLAPLAGLLWFALAYRLWQRETRHYQSAGH